MGTGEGTASRNHDRPVEGRVGRGREKTKGRTFSQRSGPPVSSKTV